MKGRLAALAMSFGVFVVLVAVPAGAKAPTEVVIQGVGLPVAVRLTDPSMVLPFLDLASGAGEETPAAGTDLSYRYIVYLLVPGETLDRSSWRFFFEPGPTSAGSYLFQVRTVVSIVDGVEQTYTWTTLYRPTGLDAILAPYAMPGAGEERYAVGDPAPTVSPPLSIRDVGPGGSPSPVLWIVAIGAAVFLAGLIVRLPRRMRSQ